MNEIDSRAVISDSARIGRGVRIGAFAVVGNGVELGDDCVLESHAAVRGPAYASIPVSSVAAFIVTGFVG